MKGVAWATKGLGRAIAGVEVAAKGLGRAIAVVEAVAKGLGRAITDAQAVNKDVHINVYRHFKVSIVAAGSCSLLASVM